MALKIKTVEISNDNLEEMKKVMKNKTVIIAFVASWCSHCQNMKSKWSDIVKKIETINPSEDTMLITVDDTFLDKIDLDHNIEGFPTIKIFKNGSETATYDKSPTSVDDIYNFVNNNVTNNQRGGKMKLKKRKKSYKNKSKKRNKPNKNKLKKRKKSDKNIKNTRANTRINKTRKRKYKKNTRTNKTRKRKKDIFDRLNAVYKFIKK